MIICGIYNFTYKSKLSVNPKQSCQQEFPGIPSHMNVVIKGIQYKSAELDPDYEWKVVGCPVTLKWQDGVE